MARPTHFIPLLLATLPLLLMIPGGVSSSTIVINEFVASNQNGLADSDGDTPDWIELYNQGSEPVDMEGWGLSDTEDNPRRWVFEEGMIAPGGFLVVFASNKDRTAGPEFHTNFAISSSGEPLLLTNADGEVVDFVPATPVPTAVSHGRQPDGSDTWVFFAEPTPGAPNVTEGAEEVLDPPLFSRPGGFYTEPFDLFIEASDPDVTIVYTLDGSPPTLDSLGGTTYLYKTSYPRHPGDPFGEEHEGIIESFIFDGEPLSIRYRSGEPDRLSPILTTNDLDGDFYMPLTPSFKGTVVRARVYREGALPSRIITNSYFITPQGRDRYKLPVVSISIQEDHFFGYEDGLYVPGADFDNWRLDNPHEPIYNGAPSNYQRRGADWETPLNMEFFGMDNQAAFNLGLGARIHGNSTRILPLKSFRVYARNAYDDTNVISHPIFPNLKNLVNGEPITEFRRLILRNSGGDYWGTMMRDGFIHQLLRPLGVDLQDYEPAIVFINGEFWGIMNLRERISADYLSRRHLLDPDEIVRMDRYANLADGDPRHRSEYLAMRAHIENNDMSDPVQFAVVADQMDMDNFIRYQAAQIYVKNTDWPGNNIEYWRKATPDRGPDAPPTHDGRWRWIFNDLDFGFAPFAGYDASHDTLTFATMTDGPHWPNPDWSTMMLRRLLHNEWFRHRFVNTMADCMNSIFQPGHVDPLVDRIAQRIAPHVTEHRARWRGSLGGSHRAFKDFARDRPTHMRQHILDFFGLPGTSEVTVNTPAPYRGRVRINSLTVDGELPGVENPEEPYPWTGTYFQGVPVEVEAIPDPNFRFVAWEGDAAAEAGRTITIDPGESLSLTALFEVSHPPQLAQPPGRLTFIEGDDALVIDLDEIFEDPNGDPLAFDYTNSAEVLVGTSLSGSLLTITPLRRGSAEITLTASNGNNDPVEETLHVLVHPEAHRLSAGAFHFGHWDPGEPDYSYPDHMLFLQTEVTDPPLDHPLEHGYVVPHDDYNPDDEETIGFPYNNTRRTRLNGLGDAGISFINTGRGRDLGGALLAIDTRSIAEASVSWLGGTLLANERVYAIRLQYRVGVEGPFEDVLTAEGEPVEYLRSVDFHVEEFAPVALPEELLGEEYVQLLWRYYWVEGDSGPRAQLRLDDILVDPVRDPGTGLWMAY